MRGINERLVISGTLALTMLVYIGWFCNSNFFVSGLQLAYTKKPEERNFRGVIALEECILEDGPEKENGAEEANGKSSKSKKASNGTAEDPTANLIFRVSHKVAYKTVLKGTMHSKYSLGLVFSEILCQLPASLKHNVSMHLVYTNCHAGL